MSKNESKEVSVENNSNDRVAVQRYLEGKGPMRVTQLDHDTTYYTEQRQSKSDNVVYLETGDNKMSDDKVEVGDTVIVNLEEHGDFEGHTVKQAYFIGYFAMINHLEYEKSTQTLLNKPLMTRFFFIPSEGKVVSEMNCKWFKEEV